MWTRQLQHNCIQFNGSAFFFRLLNMKIALGTKYGKKGPNE